jgi:hypothetical protein
MISEATQRFVGLIITSNIIDGAGACAVLSLCSPIILLTRRKGTTSLQYRDDGGLQ